MDETRIRRVRCYLTSRAPADEVAAISGGRSGEFRLLQGIRHPGIAPALDLVDHAWGPAVVSIIRRVGAAGSTGWSSGSGS